MNRKSVFGTSWFPTPVFIVCGLLVAGVSARADNDWDNKCTNRTLQGDYGFAVEGVILALPGTTLPPAGLPFRGVALTHFDGRGNLTQVDHIVAGGPPPVEWTRGTGTYTVNADCTGTLTINAPGSPFSPVKLHFVVVRNGKEIRTVVDPNPGSSLATTSIGIKVE